MTSAREVKGEIIDLPQFNFNAELLPPYSPMTMTKPMPIRLAKRTFLFSSVANLGTDAVEIQSREMSFSENASGTGSRTSGTDARISISSRPRGGSRHTVTSDVMAGDGDSPLPPTTPVSLRIGRADPSDSDILERSSHYLRNMASTPSSVFTSPTPTGWASRKSSVGSYLSAIDSQAECVARVSTLEFNPTPVIMPLAEE